MFTRRNLKASLVAIKFHATVPIESDNAAPPNPNNDTKTGIVRTFVIRPIDIARVTRRSWPVMLRSSEFGPQAALNRKPIELIAIGANAPR